MEYQKDNMIDVDYETMQQLVEEENRKHGEKSSNDRKSEKYKSRESNRDKDRDRERDLRRNSNSDYQRDKTSEHRHDRYSKGYREREKDRDGNRDRDRDKKYRRRSRSRSRSYRRRNSRDKDRSGDRRRGERKEEKRDKIVLEKTIEEARRQAMEAQRDDCTVLVYRLNFNASEKDVFDFFARAGIGRVIDIKIIRDARSGKSKGVSYVEFESQESVLLAVALSGQPIKGQAIAIQQSQAEKNRSAAASKYKKQMIKEQQRINSMKTTPGQETDAPMKIFVGGLTEHLADITEMDIRNIFPFGDIDYIDLHKDPNTGKSQGYAFIQFRKGSQARAAITAMNGFEYMGKILKVGLAEGANKHGNEMLLPSAENEDEGNSAVLHNIQSRQTLMQKLNRDGNMPLNDNFPSLPAGTTPNQHIYGGLMQNINNQKPQNIVVPGMNVPIPHTSQSSCLLLSNLFVPEDINLVEEPDFYEETKLDVKEECSIYGDVEKIWVEENSKGNVWIKFANNNFSAANKIIEKMNGRFFAKRAINAILVPESFYDNYVPR